MQVREQRAQRERRGGVVARKACKRFLAKLRADGFFARFEFKAAFPALNGAGEPVAQIRHELLVFVGERTQHRLGGGEARKLVFKMLQAVIAGKGRHVRMAGRHVAKGSACVLLIEKETAEEVAAPVVEAGAVDDRAGRDDADDIALDKALGERRVLGLLADGDLVALGDQARDVGVARMIGNAAHRRLILRRLAAVAGRQRQIELARGELSILVEHLVEVAQAEKEDRILILFLDLQILLHHRRDLGHDSSSLSFSLKSKIYTVKSEPAGISPRRSPSLRFNLS